MPICHLHVGSHKTGSSAIQAFLSGNRDVFDRNRILVPASGTSPSGSHIILVHSMLGRPVAARHHHPVAALQAEMRERPSHDIVISAELLETIFVKHPQRHPIVEFFSDAGYDIRMILYVRNAPQLLNARYAQRVKMFRYGGEFREMLDKIVAKNNSGLARWIEVAKHHRCEFVARPYTGHIQAGGLIADIMQILGFDWASVSDQFTVPGRLNEAVGPTAIAAARQIMSRIAGGIDARDSHFKSRCARILLEEVKNQRIDEPKFSGIDTDGARRLEQHFRAMNDRFARAFWNTSWDEVFAADVAENFTINDFAQTGMAQEDVARVDAICRKVLPRIERRTSSSRRGRR